MVDGALEPPKEQRMLLIPTISNVGAYRRYSGVCQLHDVELCDAIEQKKNGEDCSFLVRRIGGGKKISFIVYEPLKSDEHSFETINCMHIKLREGRWGKHVLQDVEENEYAECWLKFRFNCVRTMRPRERGNGKKMTRHRSGPSQETIPESRRQNDDVLKGAEWAE